MNVVRLHLRRAFLSVCILALVGLILIQLVPVGHIANSLKSVLPSLDRNSQVRRWVIKKDENDKEVVQGEISSSAASAEISEIWDTKSGIDKIVEQMKYIPRSYQKETHSNKTGQKIVYLHGGMGDFGARIGEEEFRRQKCPVNNCFLTGDLQFAEDADALIFRQRLDSSVFRSRPLPSQIWIFYALESPYSLPDYNGINNAFNWTATYRRHSTIVTPYAKWVPFSPAQQNPGEGGINYAAGKNKLVAWFVSNCGANNNRLEYARELGKYIDVDIIGACGTDDCPRDKDDCWKMLDDDYKFYLAFENSNCRDYITEKFFLNGLGHDVIPIVMGAHPEDYRQVAPPQSYISVEDYEDPKSLAAYLKKIDDDDLLYNEYFKWKGTGKFINTKFWCRVCALLHDDEMPQLTVRDLEQWWDGDGICQRKPWTSKRKF